jgi:hypothetical protein
MRSPQPTHIEDQPNRFAGLAELRQGREQILPVTTRTLCTQLSDREPGREIVDLLGQ